MESRWARGFPRLRGFPRTLLRGAQAEAGPRQLEEATSRPIRSPAITQLSLSDYALTAWAQLLRLAGSHPAQNVPPLSQASGAHDIGLPADTAGPSVRPREKVHVPCLQQSRFETLYLWHLVLETRPPQTLKGHRQDRALGVSCVNAWPWDLAVQHLTHRCSAEVMPLPPCLSSGCPGG